MCGVVAAFPPNPDFMDFALQVQAPRGPDATVALDLGFCCLGINRLAISGLDGGDQPLRSLDKETSVVFNGAIYNVPDLVREFGLSPQSTNDGEVIHELYERFGLHFADYLEGMYAICIADAKRERLVVVVDPIGIKPLYWHRNRSGDMLVASALNAFPPALRSGVSRVPPGTVWASDGSHQRVARHTYQEADLGDLLVTAVTEQIPHEVPWGCLLSGGVDSSLISQIATSVAGTVRTFTCGTHDSSDLLAARQVAQDIGSDHHEHVIDPDELPEIVRAVVEQTCSFEFYTVMGGVGTYLAARLARSEGVKVLLSGEGADELFGGYDEFEEVPDSYLNAMLVQAQSNLGVTECLRLDRCTMAHGIEARVPFLSTSVIRKSRQLAPSEKIAAAAGAKVRKAALRRFAGTRLPRHVAYREKVEFTQGAGVTQSLIHLAKDRYGTAEVAAARAAHPSFPIQDELTTWFFHLWAEIFGLSIGDDWRSMVDRGLVKQRHNIYLPGEDRFAV